VGQAEITMTPDRTKPGVAFWATGVVVAVLVLYPLSLLPIAWLESRGMIPEQDSIIGGMLWAYCAPVRWLVNNGHVWIRDYLKWAFGN
jgi:hypothetical protein